MKKKTTSAVQGVSRHCVSAFDLGWVAFDRGESEARSFAGRGLAIPAQHYLVAKPSILQCTSVSQRSPRAPSRCLPVQV
eukprot:2725913-Rhodomonas_salina.2